MTALTEFGWTEFFARHLAEAEAGDAARVIAEHRSTYRLQHATGERTARLSGKLRHESESGGDRPAVGDWVVVSCPQDSGDLTIQRVLPRKSKFSRKAAGERTDEQIVAANVDFVWIVSSLDQDFSVRRIERYLTLAWESGASPVVVLTKADLCESIDRQLGEVEAISIGTPIHTTSCLAGSGLVELQPYLDGHATVALLGSSGVGKSTLINALAGHELQATGDVRGDGKGRHTTTSRQLLRLPGGGLIIDTPGMRELQLWDGRDGLSETFADIDSISAGCRFSDCRHEGEPGCAVTAAISAGSLSAERLHSYQKLQRELAFLERKQDARAQADEKKRHRSISKSLRQHPKYQREP